MTILPAGASVANGYYLELGRLDLVTPVDGRLPSSSGQTFVRLHPLALLLGGTASALALLTFLPLASFLVLGEAALRRWSHPRRRL